LMARFKGVLSVKCSGYGCNYHIPCVSLSNTGMKKEDY
jgi:hypothetical protein